MLPISSLALEVLRAIDSQPRCSSEDVDRSIDVLLGVNGMAQLLADLSGEMYIHGRTIDLTGGLHPATWIDLTLTAKGRSALTHSSD